MVNPLLGVNWVNVNGAIPCISAKGMIRLVDIVPFAVTLV